MRYPCKECRAVYRYLHDLEEHKRIGHVQTSTGPTWSDKDAEEVAEEVAKEIVEIVEPLETEAQQE